MVVLVNTISPSRSVNDIEDSSSGLHPERIRAKIRKWFQEVKEIILLILNAFCRIDHSHLYGKITDC